MKASSVAASAGKGIAVGIGIAAGVILAVVLLVRTLPNVWSTTEVERDHAVVLAELRDLSRYVAATGRFTTVVDIEQDADYLPDFVKGERVIYVAEGDVEGYVDFSQLGDDAIEVSEDGSTITVRVPEPELTEADLDAERSYVAARDRGLLDRFEDAVTSGDPTDDQQLVQRAEDKLSTAADESELRALAQQNTRTFLEGIFTAAGFERVIVVFEGPVT
ncbi:MAG: DUF4230 domain-containing protein [Acidimicrobiales bacterium]|nr:DUF4230 domain-containing protein [Acidimicrobiales bacterium]MCB1259384.1 DUF4230 domain-containing protein [Acidimicrobiales bacterium]